VAAAAGKTGEEDLLLALDADTAAYFGHLRRARELSRQASQSAQQAGEKEVSASYEAVAALREGLFGNTDRARQLTRVATEPSIGRDVYYGYGLALAYAKNANGIQRFVDGFNKRFAEDTIVQFNYLPTLHAKLALLNSNPQQAIESLKVAAPYELGLPAIGFYNWPNMYPVYARGEAYLAAHRGSEAAAEFQKILDHRGIVLNEPIGALAHLQLGRAYVLQGDTPKARAAYQDFLALWRDADPDIPILQQAKAEYAKLK
jgi:tetratricopeptide (TPR) repeat protein